MAQVADVELLERKDELDIARQLAEGAVSGSGGLALVEGPAGVGKSSLLREAVAVARQLGFDTASARASELEREFAFGLVRQLFEPKLAGLTPKRREALFAGAAGLAAPLFEQLDADTITPRNEATHATLHGLYWLTVNLASKRPLTLAVDDLHWADPPSLRFLAYLANRVDELPILMVAGSRPSEPGSESELLDELATGPATRVIRPKDLSLDGVTELVRAGLGDPAPEFAAACHEATHGNPLLLRELVNSLADEGAEPTAAQAAGVLEVASRSVARSVALRIRRLGTQAGALATAVAVLGDGAQLERAASLAGLELERAATVAEALVRSDILAPDSMEFVHPVVRAAVYGQLSSTERALRHREAASVLGEFGADEDEVALHLLATRPAADLDVVETLRRAGRRAHSRGAPDVAASYLLRALSEPPPPDNRAELLVDLAHAELAVGNMSGLARMREAVHLPEDPRSRARVTLTLGRALFSWVDFAGAARAFADALEQLPDDETELRTRLEAEHISACFLVTDLRPGVGERLADLLEDSSGVSDPVLLATLSAAAMVIKPPASIGADLGSRALANGRLTVEENPVPMAMASLSMMAGGRLEQAERVWDRAAAEALAHGALYAAGFALTVRALVRMRLGKVAAAEADGSAILEKLPAAADPQRNWVLASQIAAVTERGDLDEASALVGQIEDLDSLPDTPESVILLESVGRLRLAQNRPEESIPHLRECGRRLDSWFVLNPGFIPWHANLAAALVATGEREEALELARTGVERAHAFETSRELGMALSAAGLAEGGETGIDLLKEAVDVLADSPAALEHARALTDLGAALRRAGRRAAAREPLREGLDRAKHCNALALAGRAHGELVAAGARPRRLVVSGVDSLTASERRIAEMASGGLSNREVAQSLFVTEKTVESHLGHAYRKLDIRSRSELPQALIRRPEAAAA